MDVLTAILVIAAVGIAVYIAQRFEWIPPEYKRIILWVGIIFLIVFFFRGLGGCAYLAKVRI